MASLRFTDASGTAVVSNGLDLIAGGVGSRFGGWVPFQRPVGAVATSLGTGARTMFRFRTDYGASFQVRELETVRLPEVLRLMAHLLAGGTCSVFTDDAFGRSYATCCLAPDAEPSLELANPTDLTYTLSLSLINLGGTPMLCDYLPETGPSSVLLGWDINKGLTGTVFTRPSPASFVADV